MQATLPQVVLDSSLLSSGTLRECNTASKRTGKRTILQSRDAHIAGSAYCTRTGSSSGHLDLDGEVSSGDGRETANTNSWNVLCDLRVLEGTGVGATGCAVDLGGEGTGTVLIDLVERHGDSTIVCAGWETAG